jgi:membrane protease YdiL (CAAX protease family)
MWSDDNSPFPPESPDSQDSPRDSQPPDPQPTEPGASEPGPTAPLPVRHPVLFPSEPASAGERLGGDPLASIDFSSAHPPRRRLFFPEDLRISWSWAHFVVFLLFGVISIFAVQLGMAFYIAAGRHWSPQQMQRALEADPSFLVGTNVLWFASLILFLYVTIGVLRGAPFWESLGWRKLYETHSAHLVDKGQPWMYFVAGCGLSIFVALAGSHVKENQNVPMEQLFKNKNSAMLLMAMAVLIAPLVEETVFRGYLYPLFATKLSGLAARFGTDPQHAVRFGTFCGILITGLLFGLAHGAQLGWTWGLVSLLILVGIVFTFARAWTGTVFASFLLHLGYNSTIAITTIIATHGFSRMPPHP